MNEKIEQAKRIVDQLDWVVNDAVMDNADVTIVMEQVKLLAGDLLRLAQTGGE